MNQPTIALALLLLWAAPSAAATVRLFAVGHKQRTADVVSYQTFHDKMAALMDAAFPGRASLVQAGVDDVASHLPPADPAAPPHALVVFPEDVGLMATLIGTRGAAGRAQTTSTGALVSLLGSYDPQFDHYAAKFPGQPFVRTLVLSLTDTLYRGVYETFRELAMTHGVHLSVSMNVAPARRVEAADDAALVALLRDPDEPARTYAYEAASPFPTNATFVFAPDGSVLVPDGAGGTLASPTATGGVIHPSNSKTYLTEIEQPPPGNPLGLSLAFGPVRDTEVLDSPVGRLGIVTSKPAWMIDVNDRLAAKGATVILQPEAFSSWAFQATPWDPDVFKEGGFANLQKHLGFQVNVNASMTGNFFDVTFDGQTAIFGRRQKTSPGPLGATNAFVGQSPDTGFLALAPWVLPDPGIASSGLGLAARRSILAAEGVKLRPDSGVACSGPLVVGACRNGYREAVVWADVVLPDPPATGPVDPVRQPPPRFGAALRVSGAEPTAVSQHAPRVAAWQRRVYVVWHERGPGLENVFVATSRDGGTTFSPPVRVSDNPPGAVAELHPAIAVRGGRVVVVWQEFASGRDDDRGRIKLARLSARGRKVGRDVRVDDEDGAGKWLPAVALVGASPVVAWIDERDTGPEGEPLEHVYAARGRGVGRRFEPSVRVDAGTPVAAAVHLDNKWSPTVTAAGATVYVAWTDFRNYNWDVFLARSDDGGFTFGPNIRVDDFPDYERLNERPSLAVAPSGRLHAAWTDLRNREADTNVFYAQSDDRGATFTPNRQLDDSKTGVNPDRQPPTNQWHPSLAADADRLFVAWQDDRLGNPDVFFTTSADTGATFAASERVDDTGAGASTQAAPSLALARRNGRLWCHVAWEDDRNGNPDVYFARRDCTTP
jgi:hypothetical protein